jgi:hypothetical protein
MNDHCHPPALRPFSRATVTSGRITLNHWNPFLAAPRPSRPAMLDEAIYVADMHRLGGPSDDRSEIALVPVDAPGPVPDFVAPTLLAWATAVGYARIWLPDVVLDVPDETPVGEARVTCPTCRSRWSNGEEGFFATVRHHGYFPPACHHCGGSLPEWTVDGSQIKLFGQQAQ